MLNTGDFKNKYIGDGSSGAPSLTFFSENNTGLYREPITSTSTALTVVKKGNKRLRVLDDEVEIIGPAAIDELDVDFLELSDGKASSPSLKFKNQLTTGAYLDIGFSGGPEFAITTDGVKRFGVSDARVWSGSTLWAEYDMQSGTDARIGRDCKVTRNLEVTGTGTITGNLTAQARLLTPAQPFIRLEASGAISIANSTTQGLNIWNTTITNIGGMTTLGSLNVNVPVNGVYDIELGGQWGTNTAEGFRLLWIKIAGDTRRYGVDFRSVWTGGPGILTQRCRTQMYLPASSAIFGEVFHSTSGSPSINFGSTDPTAQRAWFTVRLCG